MMVMVIPYAAGGQKWSVQNDAKTWLNPWQMGTHSAAKNGKSLLIMLLVTYFACTKWCNKNLQIDWNPGTESTQWELSNEY